jgi:hypothetical protein
VEGDFSLTVDAGITKVTILADVKEVDAPHGTSLLVSLRPLFGALEALVGFTALSHLLWRVFD